jgi:hypothetical protein
MNVTESKPRGEICVNLRVMPLDADLPGARWVKVACLLAKHPL